MRAPGTRRSAAPSGRGGRSVLRRRAEPGPGRRAGEARGVGALGQEEGPRGGVGLPRHETLWGRPADGRRKAPVVALPRVYQKEKKKNISFNDLRGRD